MVRNITETNLPISISTASKDGSVAVGYDAETGGSLFQTARSQKILENELIKLPTRVAWLMKVMRSRSENEKFWDWKRDANGNWYMAPR